MKCYNYREYPFEIHGIPFFENHGLFRRFPEELVEKVPLIKDASTRLSGVRLMFRTSSKSIKIEIKVSNVYVDRGYAFYQSNVAAVFIGNRKTSEFAGILSADNTYESDKIYGTFENSGLNDIVIHLPQKPNVEDINIYLDDDSELLPPTPFECKKNIVVYGSSIVENGHCGVQNGYPALLSREFDADFYNLGTSGVARGDIPVAEFICTIPHGLFIFDYDHNAPSPEHLRATHHAFYEYYRKRNPDTPVIMMSRPSWDDITSEERVGIIKESFEQGIKDGDKNLYLTEGRELFCGVSPAICTTDRTHPNDLGHYLMYKKISELIKKENLL